MDLVVEDLEVNEMLELVLSWSELCSIDEFSVFFFGGALNLPTGSFSPRDIMWWVFR